MTTISSLCCRFLTAVSSLCCRFDGHVINMQPFCRSHHQQAAVLDGHVINMLPFRRSCHQHAAVLTVVSSICCRFVAETPSVRPLGSTRPRYNRHQERVTMRTMSDGSFAKLFFRRQNLNKELPLDMLPEVRTSVWAVVSPGFISTRVV